MSDHDHHHKEGSGFFNGLIMGALIGAGLVFLLGTKKGRELIDEVTDKGLSLVDDFEALFTEVEEDVALEESPTSLPVQDVEKPVEQPVEETPLQNAPSPPKETTYIAVAETQKKIEEPPITSTNQANDLPSIPTHIERLQVHGRRFFHGIPKRR